MSSSFEKSVKGATKIKAAPPKTKYIEHILIATHSGEAGVAEVFRALQNRLRDSTWTVVFKSLITVHFMIREGSQDVTLSYLAKHRNTLAISAFTDVQTQGRNIRHYSNYLSQRARAYKETKIDFVRGAEGRLEKMTVDKGLLRETEMVQDQLSALLKCDVLDNEPENEITITVFRLLVLDLLALFHVLNQAMINLLGHFFEMSSPDAERALEIYRAFAKQTDYVVKYLHVARQYEHLTRVEVPKLKHAPVNLGKQLEDYLKDPDFEINRRQYIAEQDIKKGRKFPTKVDGETKSEPPKTAPASTQAASTAAAPTTAKGPDQDLIDFFDSIEQNQQPMATQPTSLPQLASPPFPTAPFPTAQAPAQYQQSGFVQAPMDMQNPGQFQQQNFNMYTGAQPQPQMQQQQQPQPQLQPQPQQLQPAFTGAGFGGYTPQPSFQPSSLQPIPQESAMSFQNTGMQPFNNQATGQTTNPFRQSMMSQPTGISAVPAFSNPSITSPPGSRQGTNPFAKSLSPQQPTIMEAPEPFPQIQQQQQQQQQPMAMPMQAMQTGTNPFARSLGVQRPATSAGLMPQPTGSTNPFRQSVFVNTATGTGWQHNQQPIGGGLDQLDTVSVFPRPAQQQAWQQ